MQAVGHQQDELKNPCADGALSQNSRVSTGDLTPVDLNHHEETKLTPPQTVVQGLVWEYSPKKYELYPYPTKSRLNAQFQVVPLGSRWGPLIVAQRKRLDLFPP